MDLRALADDIDALGGTKVLKLFDSDIFSGISVETTTENKDTLQAIRNVNKVGTQAHLN